MERPLGWRERRDGGGGATGADSLVVPALARLPIKAGPQTSPEPLPDPEAAILFLGSSSRAALVPNLLLCSQIKGGEKASPHFPL